MLNIIAKKKKFWKTLENNNQQQQPLENYSMFFYFFLELHIMYGLMNGRNSIFDCVHAVGKVKLHIMPQRKIVKLFVVVFSIGLMLVEKFV